MSVPLERWAELFQQYDVSTARVLREQASDLQSRVGSSELPSQVQSRLQTLIYGHFADVETLEPTRVLRYFAPDAVFEDPHYPNPRMEGIKQITEGITGGLKDMKRMSFSPRLYTEGFNSSAAFVLMETDHQLKRGPRLQKMQGFVVQVNDEDQFTFLKAMQEHPPGPPLGVVLGIRRLVYRLSHLG